MTAAELLALAERVEGLTPFLVLALTLGLAAGWYANRLVEAIRRAPTVTETDTDQTHGM